VKLAQAKLVNTQVFNIQVLDMSYAHAIKDGKHKILNIRF